MLTYSMVFYCGNEGKSMKVRISITPKGEKLTNVQLRDQWNNIDWNKVEKHVNRLQVRITKAVKEGKWFLVKKLQYLPVTRSYIMYCQCAIPSVRGNPTGMCVSGNTEVQSSQDNMEKFKRLI
jgi:RNA-directed DNA polymerase